jgi:hypothetical protein
MRPLFFDDFCRPNSMNFARSGAIMLAGELRSSEGR